MSIFSMKTYTTNERPMALSATLACLLELPLNKIPCFHDNGVASKTSEEVEHYFNNVDHFLENYGYKLIEIDDYKEFKMSHQGEYIVGARMLDNDDYEPLIYKDGKCIHTPTNVDLNNRKYEIESIYYLVKAI